MEVNIKDWKMQISIETSNYRGSKTQDNEHPPIILLLNKDNYLYILLNFGIFPSVSWLNGLGS